MNVLTKIVITAAIKNSFKIRIKKLIKSLKLKLKLSIFGFIFIYTFNFHLLLIYFLRVKNPFLRYFPFLCSIKTTIISFMTCGTLWLNGYQKGIHITINKYFFHYLNIP